MSRWTGRLSGVVAGMFVVAAAASAAYVAPVDAAPADVTLMAAGDIVGGCTTAPCGYDKVSDLILGSSPQVVLALGDISNGDGALTDYSQKFDRSWGRFKGVVHPVPGNHDYQVSGAANFFTYFGSAVNPPKGYYSFDVGNWHIVGISSICDQVGGCQQGSAQEAWLRADLAAHPTACTIAYWHYPRYSSGNHGDSSAMAPMFGDLYAAGADIVLSGHSHDYERFVPQDNSGHADARGVVQFVVGTGGAGTSSITATEPNSAAHQDTTLGALRLTLHATSYDWRYVPVSGSWTDTGSASCHHAERAGGTPTPTPPVVPTTPATPAPPTATPTTPPPSPTVAAPTIDVTQPSRVAGAPVTLSGTATPGSPLDVYFANATTAGAPRLLASVTAAGDGRWTHTFHPAYTGVYHVETGTSPPRRSPTVTVSVSVKVTLDRVAHLGRDTRGRCVTAASGGTFPLVPGAPVWLRNSAVSPSAPVGVASVSARGGSGRYGTRFGLSCGTAYRLFALSSGAGGSGRLADNGASVVRGYVAGS